MRDDSLYLGDIRDAANEIASFVVGIDKTAFLADRKLQLAVLQLLTVIGEAAYSISLKLRSSHPEVPGTTLLPSATSPCTRISL